MDDKTFWLTVRRALLMICKAIEKRYCMEGAKVDTMGVEG